MRDRALLKQVLISSVSFARKGCRGAQAKAAPIGNSEPPKFCFLVPCWERPLALGTATCLGRKVTHSHLERIAVSGESFPVEDH